MPTDGEQSPRSAEHELIPADTQEAAKETALPAASLPVRFRRAAVRRQQNWELPRSFVGYKAADPSLSVRGAAPKCIVKNQDDSTLWYMAKGAEKWGRNETVTEFLISRIGARLGFQMAHHGLVRVDDELRFISKSFLAPGESLLHGSLLLEGFFACDLEAIGKNPWDEQRTFDIQIIDELLQRTCQDDYPHVIEGLIEMLVFDALIGSMDRHMQNWGLIVSTTEPRRYRFAPIFDSARALVWDYDEARLEKLNCPSHVTAITGYVNRARPKIGSATFGHAVNHFKLVEYLADKYSVPVERAITKVTKEKISSALRIMREYPFRAVFSPLRRNTIAKILTLRSELLTSGKG